MGTSAPPQNLPVTEVKEKSVEKSSRQASLPPVEVGSTMMLKVEDLDMLARLKLAREKEEDCMESLVDLGEAEEADEMTRKMSLRRCHRGRRAGNQSSPSG